MKAGLVKSLVLDKRRELGALSNEELQFKADRDEHGRPILSEGQRIMVRAGLAKLLKLEKEFATLDPSKHPKMLVVCEDTTVTPLVTDFLISQGLSEDEVLRVDSNRKGELPEAEWKDLREKLFDMDEHPKFAEFYEQLRNDGYEFAEASPTDTGAKSTGDLISVGLRDGYEQFDFSVPFILREQEEEIAVLELDVTTLPEFASFTFDQLKVVIGKGDVFRSQDVQTGTQFGDYRVDGGVMTATGYNDFIARMVKRISDNLTAPVTSSSKVFANISKFPFLQVNLPQLCAWVDEYIRQELFARPFEPLQDENWRVLCLDPVANHIIQTFGRKLPELAETEPTTPPAVKQRWLSEVATIRLRESSSIVTPKCIYERLPFPSRNGGFEEAFIGKANGDSTVEAFCKVNEQRHFFMRLRYVRENGLPGFYFPDFLVRTKTGIWLTETKAQDQLIQADVRRKKIAAVAWCERLNELPPAERSGLTWNYCLLGEVLFYEFKNKGATMEEILQFARVRAKATSEESLF